MTDYSVVAPTIGRPSLHVLLRSLACASGPLPQRVVVVDDRAHAEPLELPDLPRELLERLVVLRSGGRGPAAARNCGWRATSSRWVAFVDDDVELTSSWRAELHEDLAHASERVGGVQGRIDVPLPAERPPTDWERNVAGLMESVWITADMAYRRTALDAIGGFDERFVRAYREDADLAIRIRAAGYELQRGNRRALHPVRVADPWVSVRLQRGNTDDVLMRALHGANWRALAGSPRGRFPLHAATVAAAGVALVAVLERQGEVAFAASLAWLALTADFAWRRIQPGPRTSAEIASMAATSVLIPFAAVYHKCVGAIRIRTLLHRAGA